MNKFDQIIQRTTEKLYEDERLRSHLSDDEAKVVLGWAENWIQSQVSSAKDETVAAQIAQSEFARVKQTVSAMNDLAVKEGMLNLAQAVAALNLAPAVAALEPQIKTQQAMSRQDVFKLLTQLVGKKWQMQGK